MLTLIFLLKQMGYKSEYFYLSEEMVYPSPIVRAYVRIKCNIICAQRLVRLIKQLTHINVKMNLQQLVTIID